MLADRRQGKAKRQKEKISVSLFEDRVVAKSEKGAQIWEVAIEDLLGVAQPSVDAGPIQRSLTVTSACLSILEVRRESGARGESCDDAWSDGGSGEDGIRPSRRSQHALTDVFSEPHICFVQPAHGAARSRRLSNNVRFIEIIPFLDE